MHLFIYTERTLLSKQLGYLRLHVSSDTESGGTALWDRGAATFVSLPNADPELHV